MQMAALWYLRRHVLHYSAVIFHQCQPPMMHGISCARNISKVSSMEAFVSRLLKSKPNQTSVKPKKSTKTDMLLDQNDLDSRVKKSIKGNDRDSVNDVIQHVVTSKQLPSNAQIIDLLIYLSDKNSNSMASILQLISICRENNVAFYATNLKFAPFIAQHMWQLQHFDEALNYLNSFYLAHNKKCPPIVRLNYQQIIFDAVQNQDDNILQKVIDNSKYVFTAYRDPQLLVYIWSDCFCSDVHRNMAISEQLFDSIDVIRKIVAKDMISIVTSLLGQQNLNAVHRLIQLCLKYEWKDECSVCLFELFDYERKLHFNFLN